MRLVLERRLKLRRYPGHGSGGRALGMTGSWCESGATKAEDFGGTKTITLRCSGFRSSAAWVEGLEQSLALGKTLKLFNYAGVSCSGGTVGMTGGLRRSAV